VRAMPANPVQAPPHTVLYRPVQYVQLPLGAIQVPSRCNPGAIQAPSKCHPGAMCGNSKVVHTLKLNVWEASLGGVIGVIVGAIVGVAIAGVCSCCTR